MESEGPLSDSFDMLSTDTYFGEETWEKAECSMASDVFQTALDKASLEPKDIDMVFAGDLLNQCVTASYSLRKFKIPFYGIYNACSTMAEGLSLAAMAVDGGYAQIAAAMTSSHFCSAERQYRTPLEYGGQRTPTAQWTVTGAGATLISSFGSGPKITHLTTGKICDLGITDANNMGAAMAPAAYDTLRTHFSDLGVAPEDYDLILTGDLGKLGREIVMEMFSRDGVKLRNFTDCGLLIYDSSRQDVHSGGSGAGCSASVLNGYILNGIRAGKWKKVLFAATGALLSTTVVQQGESIPGICHAVTITQ